MSAQADHTHMSVPYCVHGSQTHVAGQSRHAAGNVSHAAILWLSVGVSAQADHTHRTIVWSGRHCCVRRCTAAYICTQSHRDMHGMVWQAQRPFIVNTCKLPCLAAAVLRLSRSRRRSSLAAPQGLGIGCTQAAMDACICSVIHVGGHKLAGYAQHHVVECSLSSSAATGRAL